MSYSSVGVSSVSNLKARAGATIAANEQANIAAGTEIARFAVSMNQMSSALTKLMPLWAPLPMAPYPPATDSTNFPRTGDPSLIVSKSQVNAQQLAEPTSVMQGMVDRTEARIPKIGKCFWIGAGCLGVWWLLKR